MKKSLISIFFIILSFVFISITSYAESDLLEDKMENLKEDLIMKIDTISKTAPKYKEYEAYNPKENIKAITYDGASIQGKKTKVFAYIGYPANMENDKKYPAIVLVHGGGGNPFIDWVEAWTKRGYIAIAMANTGLFPSKTKQDEWVFGINANRDFYEAGYTNAPTNDHFSSSSQAIDRQWMYHAVAQSILAKNLLAQDHNVDPNKIGIWGISWGAVILSHTIRFEKFAFAIGQYVSAFMDLSPTTIAKTSINQAGFEYLWKAEKDFDKVDFPVLWTQWTLDYSSSIVANSATYLATPGSIFSLRMDWFHSHDWATPIEAYRFADSIVKGTKPLTRIKAEPSNSPNISFKIDIPSDANKVSAKVWYVKETLTYVDDKPSQEFYSIDLDIKGNKVMGKLPDDAHSFYVEIITKIDGIDYYTASSFIEVDHDNIGKRDSKINPLIFLALIPIILVPSLSFLLIKKAKKKGKTT